jgi:hypothetical protein
VRHSLLILACLGATLLFATSARAQSAAPTGAEEQFWPELDVNYRLNEHARLLAQAIYDVGANDSLDNQQYGINLDLFLKATPLAERVFGAQSLVADRNYPLQLRLGYRYSESLNSDTVTVQNRLLAEATGRWRLWGMIAADRNGLDWRWTNGVYSTRYRNRLQIERPVGLRDYEFTPYANAEVYYVITNKEWSGVKYELGVQLPVVSHLSAELYGAYQLTWNSTAPKVDALGLILVTSF